MADREDLDRGLCDPADQRFRDFAAALPGSGEGCLLSVLELISAKFSQSELWQSRSPQFSSRPDALKGARKMFVTP
jgi:hypothetical protein